MGASIMRAFFDDEIVVNNKAAITGELRSDSFTIRSCVNLGQKETSIPALMLINKWNVEKRLSTAYFEACRLDLASYASFKKSTALSWRLCWR